MPRKNAQGIEQVDVKVHHTAGCAVPGCGRTDAHTHTQEDWRATVDRERS